MLQDISCLLSTCILIGNQTMESPCADSVSPCTSYVIRPMRYSAPCFYVLTILLSLPVHPEFHLPLGLSTFLLPVCSFLDRT